MSDDVDPKLVRYIAMLRAACAYNGPCSDNGDGCICSAEELHDRNLRGIVPEGWNDLIARNVEINDAVEERFGGIQFDFPDGTRTTLHKHLVAVSAALAAAPPGADNAQVAPAPRGWDRKGGVLYRDGVPISEAATTAEGSAGVHRILRAWDAGREVGVTAMRAAVEKMLREWQAEMSAAGLISEHNQANVLLDRLHALAATAQVAPAAATAINERGIDAAWDALVKADNTSWRPVLREIITAYLAVAPAEPAPVARLIQKSGEVPGNGGAARNSPYPLYDVVILNRAAVWDDMPLYAAAPAEPAEGEAVAWAREVDINGPCLVLPVFLRERDVAMFKSQPENKGAVFRPLYADREAATREAVIEAAQALCNFAWSAVRADNEHSGAYLMELLGNLRRALAQQAKPQQDKT